jgi:hypothetical protein
MKMYIIIMETKFIIPEYKMKRFFGMESLLKRMVSTVNRPPMVN